MSERQTFWERLVRRAYPAHKLAHVLGRDVKDIQRWCNLGLPHNLEAIVSSVIEGIPERLFAGQMELPVGWIRLAACDGGECTQRHWQPLRGALLTIADAHLLDRLGYGALMHRPLRSGSQRQFALEFHLLPGHVAAMAI